MSYLRGIVMSKQWTEQDVLKILNLMNSLNVDSLNRLVGEEDSQTELGEFIINTAPDPQELAEAKELRDILNDAVSKLEPRHQAVIKLRYGLESGVPMTLEEVGQMYGVTRERIRQLEHKALEKLRWILITKYKIKRGDL